LWDGPGRTRLCIATIHRDRELCVHRNAAAAETCLKVHQVDLRKTRDLFLKPVNIEQLGQHDSRIAETQRLIEVTDEQIMFPRETNPFDFFYWEGIGKPGRTEGDYLPVG
jgi:hypothetical protein